jgi:hypothetical protein
VVRLSVNGADKTATAVLTVGQKLQRKLSGCSLHTANTAPFSLGNNICTHARGGTSNAARPIAITVQTDCRSGTLVFSLLEVTLGV